MNSCIDGQPPIPTGDALLGMLDALASPPRLRIVAALAGGRNYVSQLARDLGMSRPLVHLHLQRLDAAGLVSGTLELSEDGKAMKYFEVVPFALLVTPAVIAEAARTLSHDHPGARGSADAGKETEGNG